MSEMVYHTVHMLDDILIVKFLNFMIGKTYEYVFFVSLMAGHLYPLCIAVHVV
jgi:hypothetical protein